MAGKWENLRVDTNQIEWKPVKGSHFTDEEGNEYGQWVKILRDDGHALTLLSRFKAPKGKAWRLVAKAPELGEDVLILDGAYYKMNGEILAGAGEYMFNAPDAPHGGIIMDITILVHWCSGKRDYDKKFELIDFEFHK